MTELQYAQKIESIPAYTGWQNLRQERSEAFSRVPVDFDMTAAAHLTAQLDYLDVDRQLNDQRLELHRELAGTNDLVVPLPYRIGAIAATDICDRRKMSKVVDGRLVALPNIFANLRARSSREENVRPSWEPLEHAHEIGDEIHRLIEIFSESSEVDILQVWGFHFIGGRLDFDEIVISKTTKKSHVITQNSLKITETEDSVDIDIPLALKRLEKGQVIYDHQYVQPEEKYTSAPLLRLAALLRREPECHMDPADGVYIGEKDITQRLEQAKQFEKQRNVEIEARRLRKERLRGRRQRRAYRRF